LFPAMKQLGKINITGRNLGQRMADSSIKKSKYL